MDKKKKAKLEAKGWKVGDADEFCLDNFLGLETTTADRKKWYEFYQWQSSGDAKNVCMLIHDLEIALKEIEWLEIQLVEEGFKK